MTSTLYTGSYYGNGYSSSNYSSSGSTRTASSSNIRTFARNVAAGYSSQIEAMERYLEKGDTDKAMSIYDSIMEDLEDDAEYYNYNMNSSQLASALNTAYENTTGYSITDSIEENTCSSFITGLKDGLPLIGFLTNGTSSDEAIAELNGEETSTKEKIKETLGAAVTTGLSIAGGIALSSVCLPAGIALIAASAATTGYNMFNTWTN